MISEQNHQKRRLRVMATFGTRPEAIKMSPVVLELRKRRDIFEPLICVTAQHRQMLDGVLELFDLTPDYDLNIMKAGQTLEQVSTEVILKMRDVLAEAKPDVMLVHGDTTTAFAASLAAFYQKIEVGHVEAGLRTTDANNPFPEEMNRRLVGRLAAYHFAPTECAAKALRAEGIAPERILVTGNTVVDAMQFIRRQSELKLDFAASTNRRIILVTAHRRENFGRPLLNICAALRALVERNEDIEIIYPVHPNPNVINPVRQELGSVERIKLIGPLEYDAFIRLMAKSYLVLTDSGGIQEEAPTMGVPVLVMRDETERPEAVRAGTVRLVGTNTRKIIEETERLLRDREAYRAMATATQLYGDGRAAARIVSMLADVACARGFVGEELGLLSANITNDLPTPLAAVL